MFDFLRRSIVPIMIIALVGFVATIVLQWGLGLSQSQRAEELAYAAVINGEEISWQTFNRFYNQIASPEIERNDGDISDSRRRELEDAAFQQMVQDRLLMQKAEEFGITATPEEIYAYLRLSPPAYLQSMQAFQTNGQFDYNKYVSAMLQQGSGPFWRSVETLAKDDVRKIKLQQMVAQNAIVTEDEVRREFFSKTEQVEVGGVNITYLSQSNPKPEFSDEDAQAYYTDHVDEYTLEERAAIRVGFTLKAATPDDDVMALERAQALYDSIEAGADFADLALRHSDDTQSGQNDGSLGWFPRGNMVHEFDSVAFALDSGDVSPPFKTQFGYHIIKHFGYRTDREVPRGKTEEEDVRKANVSHILVRVQPTPKTLSMMETKMAGFRQKLASGEDFLKAARDFDVQVDSSGAVERGVPMANLGRIPWVANFAFDSAVGAVSDVRETDRMFYVVQVSEHHPAGPASFEKVKTGIINKLVRREVMARCVAKAEEVRALAASGDMELKDASNQFGLKYTAFDPMTRRGSFAGVGREASLIGAAFSLDTVGEISEVAEYSNGAMVFELLSRTSPDLTQFNAQRDSLYTELRNSKAGEFISSWFERLQADAEVINNLELRRQPEESQS